ncbi:MAG: ABC transporter ATP-binding protein [Bacteroidetes bacterium]|nr:ABC transporter ATP-binding protein [Bacteroidota bacterium]
MDSTTILEIRNLFCSYSRQKEDSVLFIEDLKLQEGKIIFLLGASGSGKSTLLETLGLMNNTIAEGTVKLFDKNDLRCDYSLLWKQNDLIEISAIRKNYLSFIFQNTNLMENFTACENICLSQMIKTNGKQSVAVNGAIALMTEVGLPLKEVDLNKLSVNLSGGQRQRVSFVRALNNNYKLLLCDEPTGNLDEVNAIELLKIVRDNIGDNKTAIVVSHDINLALKYADQIVLITKNIEKGYGEVLQQNIFFREAWSSFNEHDFFEFRKKLLSQFEVKKNKVVERNDIANDKKFKETTYKQLFSAKEGSVLFGKNRVNLLILISILSITFIAIGFANGALDYMNTKAKDPFVNLLTIGIPWAKSSSTTVREITDNLNADEIRQAYLIDTVTAYKETPLPIFNIEEGKSEFIKGRLVSTDDPINKFLLTLRI